MKNHERKDIGRLMREDRKIVDDAMVKGVRDAALRHKRDGLPVVIEDRGRIVMVKPEDITP
ncbi:MAG: hypothetical protein ABL961_15660 [Vicinamibacterales bacterium]